MKTIILIFILSLFSVSYSQDLLKDLLKKADKINQEILNITAPTDEEENKIGENLHKKIVEGKKIIKEYKFDIKNIFEKIRTHTARKKINYSYTILKDKDVNAYAIAGGKIYLLSGLIDFLDSEDEIAFVIAHEIAHNELKHCIKRVQYSAMASEVNPALGDLVQIAYTVYNLPFSKEQELEADSLAIQLMKKSNYDKQGAISFFRKLQKLESKYNSEKRSELNDFISTHPNTEERIKKIETY